MATAIGGWDQQAMRELYSDSAAAKRILDDLAARRKNPNGNMTSVDSLQANYGLSRAEAVEILRAFEDNGCGQFYVGRRGQPSRLEWLHSAIDVARAASMDAGVEQQVFENDQQARASGDGEGEHASTAQAKPRARTIEQRIRVRQDLDAIIQIPEDLTQAEAEKLARIVSNLWLSPAQ